MIVLVLGTFSNERSAKQAMKETFELFTRVNIPK